MLARLMGAHTAAADDARISELGAEVGPPSPSSRAAAKLQVKLHGPHPPPQVERLQAKLAELHCTDANHLRWAPLALASPRCRAPVHQVLSARRCRAAGAPTAP